MVGLKSGELQQVSLFGGSTVATNIKTAAKAKTTFSIPTDLPTDYVPPEYRSISGRKRIGLDIEGHDPYLDMDLGSGAHRDEGKIVGVAIGYSESDASYYPTAHETGTNVEDPDAFYNRLRDEAKDYDGEIVGTNLQYDLDWLRTRHGIVFPKAAIRDIQIAEPLLDENRLSYKLDVLAKDWLNARKSDDDLKRLYGDGYIKNMHLVHPAHADVYGQGDVTLPWRIIDKQMKALEDDQLLDLFLLESRLIPMLLEMRSVGVRIDLERAEEAHERLKAEQAQVEEKINSLVGRDIDIWAAESIAVAFEALGLEYNRTSTGKPSFTRKFLEASEHEIAKLIVDARAKDKTAGTFIKSYILDNHINGRIHCMFNQLRSDETGTVSGRFSSSDPNLQNIPARDPVLGPLMRSMFIPEEGMLWGSLDWSQIEYRMLVHYAEITKGIDATAAVRAYRDNPKTDFHQMASDLTGVPRKQAKNINFGVVYGMGVPLLAANLGITLDEAEEVMGQFHGNSPFMKQMLDRCAGAAQGRGFIRTILGRKRRYVMFEVQYREGRERKTAYVHQDDMDEFVSDKNVTRTSRMKAHSALNGLLQGSAADLMKKAMVDSWEAGIFDVLVPHLTVHDELNQSVPDTTEGREAFDELRHIMQTAMELKIPVLADGTLGANWDEAK